MHAGVYELKVSVCMDKGGCVSVFACTLVECKGGFRDVVNQLGIRIVCVCVCWGIFRFLCVRVCVVYLCICVCQLKYGSQSKAQKKNVTLITSVIHNFAPGAQRVEEESGAGSRKIMTLLQNYKNYKNKRKYFILIVHKKKRMSYT